MSVRRDFAFHRGETWGLDVTCLNGAGAEMNLAASGTQVLFRLATVKMGDAPATAVATWAIGTGITLVTGTGSIQSVASINITDAMQTAANIPNPAEGTHGRYRFELQVIEPNGAKSTQLLGFLDVYPSLYEEFS